MSDDDLLQFAAGKVGGNIDNHSLDGVITPYIHVWKGSKIHYLTLTSWDLFGRGLKVYDKTYKHRWISLDKLQTEAKSMSDIPLAFWQAWYRLEKEN